jgi:hypothetical protein
MTTAIACGPVASLFAIPSTAAQKPFSEWTDAEMETFLLNAEVVERTQNELGITRTDIVELDDGAVEHTAQIQAVDERETIKHFDNGTSEQRAAEIGNRFRSHLRVRSFPLDV